MQLKTQDEIRIEMEIHRINFLKSLELDLSRPLSVRERSLFDLSFNEGWICASSQFLPAMQKAAKLMEKTHEIIT